MKRGMWKDIKSGIPMRENRKYENTNTKRHKYTPPGLHCFQTCGHKSTYITKLNTTQLVICRGSSTAYAQPLIVEMNSQNHIFFQIKSNQIRIV